MKLTPVLLLGFIFAQFILPIDGANTLFRDGLTPLSIGIIISGTICVICILGICIWAITCCCCCKEAVDRDN